MTTSHTHSAEEEEAIRFRRRQYNASNGTSLTAGQYADLLVANLFAELVASVKAEREGVELSTAFKSASQTTKDQVRQLLGITNP